MKTSAYALAAVLAINFTGISATDMNHSDGWEELTKGDFINAKKAQDIKAYCNELPITCTEFKSLLDDARFGTKQFDSIVRQGLIKFHPDPNKNFIFQAIKSDISKSPNTFFKLIENNVQKILKKEEQRAKTTGTATPSSTEAEMVDMDCLIQAAAKNREYRTRKQEEDAKNGSPKLAKDVTLLLDMAQVANNISKQDYIPNETDAYVSKLTEHKERLFQDLIQSPDNAWEITKIYIKSYRLLVENSIQNNGIFDVFNRFIKYLKQTNDKKLTTYTLDNGSVMHFYDGRLLIGSDLLEGEHPVFTVTRNQEITANIPPKSNEIIDAEMFRICRRKHRFISENGIKIAVKTVEKAHKITELIKKLKTEEGRIELVSSVAENGDTTAVHLKDGTELTITPTNLGKSEIIVAKKNDFEDSDVDNNWWDFLEEELTPYKPECSDEHDEIHVSRLIASTGTYVVIEGKILVRELLSFLEELRANGYSERREIKILDIKASGKTFITFKDGVVVKLFPQQSAPKEMIDMVVNKGNWMILLGNKPLINNSTETDDGKQSSELLGNTAPTNSFNLQD